MIEQIKSALASDDMEKVDDELDITNPPVLYKGNLVIGINKYLNMHPEHRFYMISSEPIGYDSVFAPEFWIDDTLNFIRDAQAKCKEYTGAEEFFLSLSALSVAFYSYDRMVEMLSTPGGIAEFDKFLAESYKQRFSRVTTFNTRKVLDCLKEQVYSEIPSDILEGTTVLLGNDYTSESSAILALNDCDIKVVTKVSEGYRVVTFMLPDWYLDTHNIYEKEFGENPFKTSAYPIESLVQFVLMYSGVLVQYVGFLPMRKDIDMQNPIQANIKKFRGVNDLDNFFLERER